jgi:hypothetical protein
MKVTADMKVKDVLKINERMLDAFTWLAPQFERLRNPGLRKVMANRVTVEQAARIAKVPLTEALYVLNIVAGVEARELHTGMHELPVEAFQFHTDNAPRRPREIAGLSDDDERVRLVDVMPHARLEEDPLPTIMREMLSLHGEYEVVLVRHPFDPVPLRDLFARRGFASWAEERRPNEWYIYFYRPSARATAVAHPSLPSATYACSLALVASA